MKKLYTLIASMCIFTTLLAQIPKDDKRIDINSKFILNLTTSDSINYTFRIFSKETFNETLDMSLLDNEVRNDAIQGILSYQQLSGKFCSVLLIKNGMRNAVSCKLKIKRKNRIKPIKTYILCLSNAAKTELWRYQIEYMELSNFKYAKQSVITLP
jgi:hypothetical protein